MSAVSDYSGTVTNAQTSWRGKGAFPASTYYWDPVGTGANNIIHGQDPQCYARKHMTV